MPNPLPNEVHINVPLTNIAVAYMQSADKFIADKVFPVVPVNKQADFYFRYYKEDWTRVVAQERAPATESAGGGWRIDNTPTYYARVYAVHKDVDDQTRGNTDDPIDLDRDATEWVTEQLLLKRELVFVNNYFSTGIWGTDRQGVAGSPSGNQFVKWSDYANSNPIADVKNSVLTIAESTGYKPNVLVVAPDVFNVLTEHPDVLDRIKYTQRAVVTEDLLAGLFGVERFIVPWAVVNNAAEGASADMNFVFKGKALLAYAAPAPSLFKPSAGYIFAWKFNGLAPRGLKIKNFRMENLAADRIEGEMAFDIKVVGSDLGVLFYDVV